MKDGLPYLSTIWQNIRQVQLKKKFADNKKNVTEKMNLLWTGRKHAVKGENASYHHCLLFPQCLIEAFPSRSLKVVIVWDRVSKFLSLFGYHTKQGHFYYFEEDRF